MRSKITVRVFVTVILVLSMMLLTTGCDEEKLPQTRKVTNFNYDWQFVRVNDKPKPIDTKFLVPRDKWKIIAVSSEETKAESTPATNAIDGNDNTFWHTKWQGTPDEFPHELTIDLGSEYNLQGLTYLARQNGDNGMIGQFELYASNDLTDWGEPVTKGRFRNEKRLQAAPLAKPVSARYVRVVAISSINGQPFASAAEIGFLKIDAREKAQDWEAQFSVLHVGDESEEQQAKNEMPDGAAKSLAEELSAVKEKTWEPVSLPHTAYIEPLVVNNQWQGICFYRKSFDVGEELKGKQLFIEFEGAMELADVWINDKHILRHAGGYLPFTIDITDAVTYGETNAITVKLDNYDHPTIPPGKPLSGVDFSYYHGIYRDVNFIVTDRLHITDPVHAGLEAGGGIFVTYADVCKDKATINVKTHVKNSDTAVADTTIIQALINKDGKTIATSISKANSVAASGDRHIEQSFTVDNPDLWSPNNPYLYTLRTVIARDGKPVDQIDTKIGIRWFEFSREEGFKVNGKPIFLNGTNRHQEYPYIGNALSNNAQYRDIWKIRNAGFNTLRLGHYPQDPAVLDACDKLGMIVIEPIPGWQFFNNSEIFIERIYDNVREMIRRDRNHPSVALWEVVLNESWAPQWLETKAYEIAHKELPGPQCFACGDPYGAKCWDVSYNQWQEDITRPQNAQLDKPGFIREYGDFEFGGHYSTSRQYRRDGQQGLLQSAWNFQWSLNRYKAQYPWTVGCATWLMYDHNRGGSENVEASGTADIFRIPKFTYYFFQSQRSPFAELPTVESGPMIHIANYWTEPTSSEKVIVYSNCDLVELFVNGKSVVRQKPDSGPSTEYGPRYKGGNSFDGGNAEHLDHPPFTFTNVTFKPGKLKAVGYINGKEVTQDIVSTPGNPAAISIDFDTSGRDLTADGSDTIFVYASIIDDKGNPNFTVTNEITFEVNGPAKLIGDNPVIAEAGIATILMQADTKPGSITVSANSNELMTASAKIISMPE